MALKTPQQKKKKRNPLFFIVACLVVVLVCTMLGYSMVTKNNQSENATSQAEQTDNQTDDYSHLTDEQKKLYDGYSGDQKSVFTILKNNKWLNGKQTDTIEFGDGSYVENKEGETGEKKYFVICALKTETETPANSSKVNKTTITCMNQKNQYFYITLSESVTSQEQKSYSIESDAFEKNKIYMQVSAKDSLKISLGDEVSSALPFDKSSLFSEVKSYVAKNYPSASEVIFLDSVEINYKPVKYYRLQATCNNAAKTKLNVIWSEADKTFTIEKSKSS